MYTIEFIDATGGALDRAVAGTDRELAVDTAKRMLAIRGDLATIRGIRVTDQNGVVIFSKYTR